jgi:chaperonin GroES
MIMKGTFKPLGDRVLVKPESFGETKTKGGLILTETAQRGQKVYGEVISVGTGIFSQSGDRIPMTVEVGDIVMYEKDMAGSPIEIEDEKFLIFNEHQLIGILKK